MDKDHGAESACGPVVARLRFGAGWCAVLFVFSLGVALGILRIETQSRVVK